MQNLQYRKTQFDLPGAHTHNNKRRNNEHSRSRNIQISDGFLTMHTGRTKTYNETQKQYISNNRIMNILKSRSDPT